jgi:hypothetical protein
MNYRNDVQRRPGQRLGRAKQIAGLLLAAFLVGCVVDPSTGSNDTATQASGQPGSASNLAVPSKALATPAPDGAPEKTNEPAVEPPPAVVRLPPLQLVGMSQNDILLHLGQPAFQRRDRTALLLRYREGACILDLFLYPSAQSNPGKAVDYIEARDLTGQLIETMPCVDAVRKARVTG